MERQLWIKATYVRNGKVEKLNQGVDNYAQAMRILVDLDDGENAVVDAMVYHIS